MPTNSRQWPQEADTSIDYQLGILASSPLVQNTLSTDDPIVARFRGVIAAETCGNIDFAKERSVFLNSLQVTLEFARRSIFPVGNVNYRKML